MYIGFETVLLAVQQLRPTFMLMSNTCWLLAWSHQ